MKISPDEYIVWSNDFININYTLIYTWVVMLFLIFLAYITRKSINNKKNISKIENFFEVVISIIENQVKSISTVEIKLVFPIIATFFMFILTSNLISLIPTFKSPTASLSTTVALTIVIFILSIYVGIKSKGLRGYFSKFLKPIPLLLPLNIISTLTTNFSLAIRLYGNVMSSGVVALILSNILFLSIGFPIIVSLLGVISGCIQAYIFSILAMIFVSSE